MSCCLKFLFFNSLAGVFVFVVLGIFVITDSPFLIIMNVKEEDGVSIYKNIDKKHAYYQYFAAAGFNAIFAFIIWYIPSMIEILGNKNENVKRIRKKSELQVINEGDEKLDNNNDNNIIKESNNIEINTNSDESNVINNVNTGKSIGMTEKLAD